MRIFLFLVTSLALLQSLCSGESQSFKNIGSSIKFEEGESIFILQSESLRKDFKSKEGRVFSLNLSKWLINEFAEFERKRVDPDNTLKRGHSGWKVAEEILAELYSFTKGSPEVTDEEKQEVALSYAIVLLGRHPTKPKENVSAWKLVAEVSESFPGNVNFSIIECYRQALLGDFDEALEKLEKLDLSKAREDLLFSVQLHVFGFAKKFDDAFELLDRVLEEEAVTFAPGLRFFPFLSLEEINSIYSGLQYSRDAYRDLPDSE